MFMKKVRFQTCDTEEMNDSECHSPRPFLEKRANVEDTSLCYNFPKSLTFSMDPVHRFETSNSSPYPIVNRTNLDDSISPGPSWSPSSELELSMLDATNHEPRKLPVNSVLYQPHLPILPLNSSNGHQESIPNESALPTVLGSIENMNEEKLSKKMNGDSSFFITKGNLKKFQMQSFTNLHRQFNRLTLDKENNPASKKLKMLNMGKQEAAAIIENKKPVFINSSPRSNINDCSCHHCARNVQTCDVPITNGHCENNITPSNHTGKQKAAAIIDNKKPVFLNSSPTSNIDDCSCHHCVRNVQTCDVPITNCLFENNIPPSNHVCQCMRLLTPTCNYSQCACHISHPVHRPCQAPSNSCEPKPQNAVDKKSWAIEKYEQIKNTNCTEVQKPTSVKEKREPTVADLFKIIKLQNEQLQLLQEKVDKFISSDNKPSSVPIQSYTTEHVALETMNEQHKISIGVMTSFEMVRTSTVINKEMVQQTENSQIHCNRSHLSIKEVVSKSPVNLNFLDGIPHMGKNVQGNGNDISKMMNGNYEEKTLNELSLYNVQVDNATTPLMSPDQTLYLDVRDYSDSDTGSDDQSNVGWTYYNKVMTHVNGMLQDSDMPSSASALYRNTRQHCVQMQIDKTNVSVTKRVKFGDDPLGIHQPHIYAATTDTSMKMNQLAAKYLKVAPAPPPPPPPAPAKTSAPFDMSFATRNYMERHKLMQGVPGSTKEPTPAEIPRFLDITALKQQPKLL